MLRLATVFSTVLSFASAANGADVDYLRDVKPLLAEKCASCHGPLKQEAGLRLDATQFIRKGSDYGPVTVAQAPAESLLLARVSASDAAERMPPEGDGAPLNAKQLALIERWIKDGLPGPAEEEVLSGPEDHWAYQPVVRPEIPATGQDADSNPIDSFLAVARREGGVETVGPADPGVLLRRLSLDLLGLPPTVPQIEAFLADSSEAAYLREVDRMLSSPQYGERWARHWMDVWRYSDWDGYKKQLRGSQRHIWRWRDWIVESLNHDKGYNRMVMEMLAGDELAPQDSEMLRATGFLARNYHHSNRDIWLDAAVEHTAKAFLGMTLACARCHDHKFDPIEQQEYYAFRAIFEPYRVRTEPVPGQVDTLKDGLSRVYDADLDVQTYLYVSGNEKQPDKDNPLEAATPSVIDVPFEVEAVSLPVAAYFPAVAEHRQRDEQAAAESALKSARKKLQRVEKDEDAKGVTQQAKLAAAAAETQLASLRARWTADMTKYLAGGSLSQAEQAQKLQKLAEQAAAAERVAKLAQAELERFNKKAALDKIEIKNKAGEQKHETALAKARKELKTADKKLAEARKASKNSDSKYTSVGEEYPHTSTGRRSALARWITDPSNPLTARVAVNHIWLRHFGQPLVDEVFDFGLRSPRPIHADLLDWLAAEFMENEWSMKHLHRLIVTSQAYQLASSDNAAVVARNRNADPDNHLWWRADTRRLDAEVIRDSLLHLAGKLDLSQGGPDIDYSQGETVTRRSIYFRHAYEKQMQMLVLFDAASPTECYRRSESIIPQQALALSNSGMAVSLARQLAAQLQKQVSESSDPPLRFIKQAFWRVLCRAPTAKEIKLCSDFMEKQSTRLADSTALSPFEGATKASVPPSEDSEQRARENLVHVLMNHNDFVTVR